MRTRVLIALVLAVAAGAAVAPAQTPPARSSPAAAAASVPSPAAAPTPPPVQWVTDTAGLLSGPTAQALNARLRRFEELTGNQVIVWIGTSIGNRNLEEWAANTFAAWGIGQKGKDNGLALFILTRDRKIRIEVGYDLEGRVTDLLSSRVIREILEPGLAAGRANEAVTKAVDVLLNAINPKAAAASASGTATPSTRPSQPRKIGLGTILLWGLLGVGFLILFITNPTLALFLLFSLMSGGRGGGGGGGFGGGGGRSGGGGASGGW
ncbi:MAG: TPM domain-containing protein [Acidobacteria bacterium]|nr:TPM domain-containing protein [Acidobacteriota bacterium]